MNYWFEVFHNGRCEKCDSYHEAHTTAKQLTSSGCFSFTENGKHAYIVKHTQLDNSDERVSISLITFIAGNLWTTEELM